MIYPISHIQRLRRNVIKQDLPRPPEFDQATDDQIQSVYNGIGSDKFSNILKITTDVFEAFEASALIHDFGWSELWNDGSRERWTVSNNRFREGNLILASTCGVWFGWLRPQQRTIYRAAGDALYRVVASDDIGWPIWRDAEHCEPGPEVMA